MKLLINNKARRGYLSSFLTLAVLPTVVFLPCLTYMSGVCVSTITALAAPVPLTSIRALVGNHAQGLGEVPFGTVTLIFPPESSVNGQDTQVDDTARAMTIEKRSELVLPGHGEEMRPLPIGLTPQSENRGSELKKQHIFTPIPHRPAPKADEQPDAQVDDDARQTIIAKRSEPISLSYDEEVRPLPSPKPQSENVSSGLKKRGTKHSDRYVPGGLGSGGQYDKGQPYGR